MLTIQEKQENIIQNMSGLEDWLDKYQYLNDLGKQLDPLEPALKSEENMLPGCQSKVWVVPDYKEGRLSFKAESDSTIIQGIIALLLQVLNNQSPEDIAQADLFFISEIGLSKNLSPSRANGVATIIKELKQRAQDFVVEGESTS